MTQLIDLHVHTTNSPDAALGETELARRASSRGLSALGFVAHVDFHPKDFCALAFRAERYDSAVREARASIPAMRILKGVEIGEPHRFMPPSLEALGGLRYDYVVGALHWVGDLLVLDPWDAAGGSHLDAVERYFEESLLIASGCDIDVVAHLGIFRRGLARAGLDTGFDEASLWPGLLRRIFEAMIDRGIALELNTSGLRRREGITYPSPGVLAFYRGCGGTLVTLGSDTHDDPWVFFGLEEGASLLRDTGFEEVCAFEERRRIMLPL
jgi:histidinol-phosphatase (PHP family)